MKKRIDFVETVLRDSHQSLMATRMKYSDFKDALDLIDNAGYHAVECWGGATFDSCIRFLDEDPWERIRNIKSKLKNTKTQMLLRGQNLLGYKNYPDDVVEKFIELSIKNGVDIVRIFDALNDLRNLETSIAATKKYGAEAQVTLCYTISDVHTVDYFTKLASDIEEMGADSIAIKDMAGILRPYEAYELVRNIRMKTDIPLEIHSHTTTGLGTSTLLKAIEAGVDIIDTSISPFAGGTSHPPTETLHMIVEEKGYYSPLKIEVLQELAEYFEVIKEKYIADGTLPVKMLTEDPKGLIYQVPGGMLSNLYNQLKGLKQLDKYNQVLSEVPRVRKDLGYPPLVTPISQMVGTQSAFNVIMGQRYKMVPNEIKDYLRGYYGKSPVPIDDTFRKSIIGEEEPITDRPANHLKPKMDYFRNESSGLARTEEDVLTYAMFPEVAKTFLKNKYGL